MITLIHDLQLKHTFFKLEIRCVLAIFTCLFLPYYFSVRKKKMKKAKIKAPIEHIKEAKVNSCLAPNRSIKIPTGFCIGA